jgi:PAS domain S-box-containing protein
MNLNINSGSREQILKDLTFYQLEIWDALSDMVFFVDNNFTVQIWNRRAEKELGWKVAEAVGKNIWDIVRPEPVRISLKDALKKAFRHGTWQGDAIVYHKNNSKKYANLRLQLIYNSEKEITGGVIVCEDLTQQKNNQQILAKSQAQFKALVQNSSDMITIVKADGTQIYISATIETHLGIKASRTYKKSIFERVHPDDLPAVLSHFSKVLKEPEIPVSLELRYKNIKNEYVYLSCIATNRLNDKNIEGIIINAHDITENKKAETLLRNSEARFKALVQHSSDVIIVLNADGTRSYVSPAVSRVLGRNPEDMIGKNAFEDVHPDDIEQVKEKFRKLLQNAGGSSTFFFRHKVNEQILYIDSIGTNLLYDEQVRGIILNVRNVTDSYLAEEKVRQKINTSLTHSPDIFVLINEYGYRTYVSPSIEKVLGWRPEQLVGTLGTEYVHPDDIESAIAIFHQSLRDPDTPLKLELRIPKPDQSYVWLECIVTNRLRDANVKSIIFNCRDVTDNKLYVEKLRRSKEKFEALVTHSPDVILILLFDGTTTYVSPSSKIVLGRIPEELTGKYATEYVHPDDFEVTHQLLINSLKNPDILYRHELRFLHSSGNYIWLECIVNNCLKNPSVEGIIVNCWDISDRKMGV